jgi:RNA 2',3'-cyclic 3'-phosphodiesterase
MALPLRPGNRLFAALDLPEDVRARLAATGARVAGELGGRAVGAERLHLTLHFLGRVPPECGPDLVRALRVSCAASRPLRMRLGALVGRPSRGRARLCARELRPEGDGLGALHGALGEALAEALGRPIERARLWPHVTLVRFRTPVRLATAVEAEDERPFDVGRAALYDSVQSPGAPPRYEPVVTADLGTH